MTPTITELTALLADATPGPWTVNHRHIAGSENDDEMSGLGLEIEGPPEPILRGQFSRSADARLAALGPELARRLVGSLVVEQQDCENCYEGKVCPGGERHQGIHTCMRVSCPVCVDGKTWPDLRERFRQFDWHYCSAVSDASPEGEQEAIVRVLDMLKDSIEEDVNEGEL